MRRSMRDIDVQCGSERNILDHGSIIGVEHEPAMLAVRIFSFRKIDAAILAGRPHEA